ncbi:MAG: hypothetical protein HJJLKODD_01253 [Phycisphaerae bacterium]|nr:hypothetical protein [Phycisphaerae bacterium]
MHTNRCRGWRRGGLLIVSLLVVGPMRATAAPLQVPYESLGEVFQLERVDDQLLVTAEGLSAVQLAVRLSEQQLSNQVRTVGDNLFAVQVNQVSPAIMQTLRAVEGVTGVYRAYDPGPGPLLLGLTDQILIRFAHHPSAAELADFAADYELTLVRPTPNRINYFIFKEPAVDEGDVVVKSATIRLDARVRAVHPDFIVPISLHSVSTQDEPLFEEQWHLDNQGQFGPQGLHDDINVLSAWDITGGQGARIAMLDSGVDIQHEDLIGNYLGFSNSVVSGMDDAQPPAVLDPQKANHGTAVLGLIVAGDNGVGLLGVAPEAEWTATGGLTGPTTLERLAEAFTGLVDQEISVHNNSWSSFILDPVVEAIADLANNGRQGRGTVIVFSMGNGDLEIADPVVLSALDTVIGVGGTGQTGLRWTDTVRGGSDWGRFLDIMAPTWGNDDVSIRTTDRIGSAGYNNGGTDDDFSDGDYTRFFGGTGGTSAAAPILSGVAALVLSNEGNPELNRFQVRELLLHTADQVSPFDADYGPVSGFSMKYGYGRVNAGRAVEAAVDSQLGQTTWPGIPADIQVVIQSAEGDDSPELNLSWRPTGMPLADGTSGVVITDETEILIGYQLDSGGTELGTIAWRPMDGEHYDGGDLADVEDGDRPDPTNPDFVILYQGSAEELDDFRREVIGLAISGEADSPQFFSLYAMNSKQQYSFGVLFNEKGEVIDDFTGEAVEGDQPGGRELDPYLYPSQPGRNQILGVTATADQNYGVAPLTVTFHGGTLTPNPVLSRGWSLGDGASDAEVSVTHTYQLPGYYLAIFHGQDQFGVVTKTIEITVVESGGAIEFPEGVPSARISLDSHLVDVLPGTPLRFSVDTEFIGLMPDSIVEYEWDFGDGHFATGQTVENVFELPGSFAVVVRVREELPGEVSRTITATYFVEVQEVISPAILPGDEQPIVPASTGGCGAMGTLSLSMMVLGCLTWRRRFAHHAC